MPEATELRLDEIELIPVDIDALKPEISVPILESATFVAFNWEPFVASVLDELILPAATRVMVRKPLFEPILIVAMGAPPANAYV
nr:MULTISPECIES: hypothetical protein [Pandoraea]